jgi:hypothetical protein
MHESMDRLPYKVNVIWSSLVIKKLKFMGKLSEPIMSFLEVHKLDFALINDPYTVH